MLECPLEKTYLSMNTGTGNGCPQRTRRSWHRTSELIWASKDQNISMASGPDTRYRNDRKEVLLVSHRRRRGQDGPAQLSDPAAVISLLQSNLETILQPPILINLLHEVDKMAAAAGSKVKHLSKQRPMKTKGNLNLVWRTTHLHDTRQLLECWHEGMKVLKDPALFQAS